MAKTERNGGKPQPGTGPACNFRGAGFNHTAYAATGLHPKRMAFIQAAVRAAHGIIPRGTATSL